MPSTNGQLCQCGGRGCFWLRTSIHALLEGSPPPPTSSSPSQISATPRVGTNTTSFALWLAGHALGLRVADAVVVLDPDAIIIDGALGDAAVPIVDGVRGSVNQFAPPAMARDLPIVAGTLGIRAALVGAAALARVEGLLEPSGEIS